MKVQSLHGIHLEFFWKTKEHEKKENFELADRVFKALIKDDMRESEARDIIEKLWSNSYRQGYVDGAFDHQDCD
jgi:hypothetical protein